MKTELRFKEKQLTLANQEIIELAYTTKEIIEYSYGGKLFFEQANCYSSCFYTIRNLLEQVDQKYLDKLLAPPQQQSISLFKKIISILKSH